MNSEEIILGLRADSHMLHAYLICSGDNRGEELAADMARTAVCTGKGVRPCNVCPSCQKAIKGIHPDIITVSKPLDAKGSEKSEIVVSQARDIISEAYVLPNEAEAKVFIIRQADSMNISAQNALLKLLEEPPSYAYFFIVASNPGLLLTTVRSRLAQINVSPAGIKGEELELTQSFFEALEMGGLTIAEFCVSIEKLTRDTMREFLQNTQAVISEKMRGQAVNGSQLMAVAELFSQMEGYNASNVSSGHIAGTIAARLCV